ncbi:MAG: amidohydrolase family protein [Solirubrobacteraceae bacterium]|nr:amidohydrolase family protein [Solirubrobacteraceae bacterium]
MPVVGVNGAEELRPLLGGGGLVGATWFDAHTHIGHNDPDGLSSTVDELLGGLDQAGHARALVFPMHEPDGYRAANDTVLEAARGSGGRLDALARVDPNRPDCVEEARRCLDAGARGIKMHPRSDAFTLPHPEVERLVALAAERRAIVLFHAGRGIPRLGIAAVDMARANPGARIVLAHAGISDVAELAPIVADIPNLLFDTAWWQVSDVLDLFVHVPPGQILYGSDMPYGPGLFSAFALLRCGRAVGHSDDILREIAGGQLTRIVDGQDPLDLGPAAGATALGARSIAHERVISYLSAAVTAAWAGGDTEQSLSLARLAIAHGHDPLLAVVDELIARTQDIRAARPESPRAGLMAALTAQFLAGTPTAGLP